ncbi:MAG: hypothetical protein FWF46_08345 [Oscillospiraceae bacterium]|nr:hypothetical protein [Oscillospiraceae bacterium]
METAILQQIQDELKVINKKLDNCVTKDEAKNFATKDDLLNFATKDDLLNFAAKDDLSNFATKDDFKQLIARFDTFENKLESINKRVLIMEHELTTKVQILLETNVDTRVNYDRLRMNVSKLNEVTEMHTMQIEFLQDKINS